MVQLGAWVLGLLGCEARVIVKMGIEMGDKIDNVGESCLGQMF